jgi:hypothetical protein
VAATEPLQHYQPRPIFSTWLGMVLLFSFFALLVFVLLKAAPRGNTYEKKRAEVRAKKLEDAQKENLAALTTYAWVDKAKGVARIPINDAMQIMLRELPDKKPTAAGPIAAASPAAAPQTSPAASPGASANATATPVPDLSTTPKPTSVSGEHSEAHNQPAAAANPPSAPPNTQPGANTSPAASAPPPAAKAPATPSPSVAPSAPGTPLPVQGKTP